MLARVVPFPTGGVIRSRFTCLLPLTVRSSRLQAQDLQHQLFLALEPLPNLSRDGAKCTNFLCIFHNACEHAPTPLFYSSEGL